MRHTLFRWLAVSSLLVAALAAHAAQHPRYGGALRVEMRAAPVSLDPTDEGAPLEVSARARIAPLLFDTLFRIDADGRVRPQLADWFSFQNDSKSWKFAIAQNIKFTDGTPLTAADVAASLASANPDWQVRADGQTLSIDTTDPHPAMLAELALSRNAIVRRTGGTLTGTGPFSVAQWQPGQRLVLKANEDYWKGRPFVDEVDIDLGRAPRDQSVAFDLGHADIIEVAPDQPRADSRRLRASKPVEVFAIVFDRARTASADPRLRQAISLAADRASIARGIFQGSAEPAGSILPQWVSGYAFLFPAQRDANRARQLNSEAHFAPVILAYPPNDGIARLIAERIVLNARDAGITIQTTPSTGAADAHIVRAHLPSTDPRVALAVMTRRMGTPLAHTPWTLEDAYKSELSLLKDCLVVPLVTAQDAYGVSDHVRDWSAAPDGAWHLEDLWLEQP